jgi:drug/metabolite transporter (DMT)-like permease
MIRDRRWTVRAEPADDGPLATSRPAGSLILLWAFGCLVGALALQVLPPFLLLSARFVLSAVVLGLLAVGARATWPRGRPLAHTVVAGLLMRAAQNVGLYTGMAGGVPPAVSALVIAVNPVVTTMLAAVFLGERLTRVRIAALGLGTAAVVAALGSRVLASGRLDPATLLTVIALLGLSAGGAYQRSAREDRRPPHVNPWPPGDHHPDGGRGTGRHAVTLEAP